MDHAVLALRKTPLPNGVISHSFHMFMMASSETSTSDILYEVVSCSLGASDKGSLGELEVALRKLSHDNGEVMLQTEEYWIGLGISWQKS